MPEAAPAAGPLDEQLAELNRRRFEAVVARFPVLGTLLGDTRYDDRLADNSADAVEQDIADARRYLSELERIDPADLSPYWQVERELAALGTRRQLFDDAAHCAWERRASATDELGDGIFILLARESRPPAERLAAIAGRLEAAPQMLLEHRTRLRGRPVRLWLELELESARSMPPLFDEVVATARGALGEGQTETARIARAATAASAAVDDYVDWLDQQLERGDDSWPMGPELYDELIGLRAFDGLTADDILEIGERQLADSQTARRQVASEIDGGAPVEAVIDRVKSDHPADFDSALLVYRRAMDEAREFVVEHQLSSLPEGESLAVIATPEYLRSSLPFAAYFAPQMFAPELNGVYVVTPSVDGDPRALREHNHASIYNTSIHEAYPGHHQQLSVACRHPSLVRPLYDAPEFVEGWAMYCEQMMREEGFDTAAPHRLMMHNDEVWRACRIIADVRLHRAELSVAEAGDFLIQHTAFERPHAMAEVNRYTTQPTYALSYMLGKVLLLRLRADEQARLGSAFSLKEFHDSMLREGTLPISFQRRLLVDRAAATPTGPRPA